MLACVAAKLLTISFDVMSSHQRIIDRLIEILEVDFSWYEECQQTWESEGDVGWVAAALQQADECEEVRAAATEASVEAAMETVAMVFGWERLEDEPLQ